MLVVYGALARRRFTTWAWAVAIAFGVILLIQKAAPDNNTSAGIIFVIVGAVLVLVGVAITTALNEREYPGT